ncbi:MAG: lamin tail domain-containing protein [Balneolia bacterium]|nr:lamin tail domain-containing protein [Balneolia bacterium]
MRITLILLSLFLLPTGLSCTDNIIEPPESFDPGSIIINEIMGPAQQLFGPEGAETRHGWIELYNPTDETIALRDWELSYSGTGTTFRFPAGLTLSPGRYLLLWMRPDSPEFSDSFNTGIELTGDGGRLTMLDPNGTEIDFFDIPENYNHPVISTGLYRFNGFNTQFILPFTTPSPGMANSLDTLEAEASYQLNIGDPSGISADATGGPDLWIVGDNPGDSVYKVSRTGEVIKTLDRYQGEDTEGIAQHPGNFSLWIAEERQRALVNIDTLGYTLGRIELDIPGSDPNNGIEGLTIHPETFNFYAVNKRNPRLFLEISPQGDVLRLQEMNFGALTGGAGISMAGLWYDAQDDVIWLVSDESRAIFILSTEGETLAAFHHGLNDTEGIAGDRENNLLFLVSDSDAMLYHLPIPNEILHLGN